MSMFLNQVHNTKVNYRQKSQGFTSELTESKDMAD